MNQPRTLITDELLMAVSAVYLETLFIAQFHSGRPKPAVVVAAKFDRPIATANRWIKAAKARGFLNVEDIPKCDCECHEQS